MSLVDWQDKYSVNIEEIDNQHKNLVSMLNKLHEALQAGKARETLGEILDELVEYTVYHFSTEEKYFYMYGYPDTEEHKKQHSDLVEQVGALVEKFKAGEKVLTIQVMNFLRDWINDHILGSDTKFGPFLREKGMK